MKTYLLCICALWIIALACFEKRAFHRAGSFSPHLFLTYLPSDPKWNLPLLEEQDPAALSALTTQKFSYLGRGTRCFAFLSEDGQYVVKLHRYPSTLRLFPFLKHPWDYFFNLEQQKRYLHHLNNKLQSYTNAFFDLKEESGILLMRLNRSQPLKERLVLIDQGGTEHTLPLDPLVFIIQKRAQLIYPTLTALYAAHQIEEAKAIVTQLLDLMASDYRKGYRDLDPTLHCNYGLLENRAMHIDVGDLMKNKEPLTQQGLTDYLIQITTPLKERIAHEYPELLSAYNQKIQHLKL